METRGPSVFDVAFRIVLREDDGSYSRTDASRGASCIISWAIPKRGGWALSTVALGPSSVSRSCWKDLVYHVSVVIARAKTVEIESTVSLSQYHHNVPHIPVI